MRLFLAMLLALNVFSQQNQETSEYEKQLDQIQDEKLKEEIRKKIAEQIANEITQKTDAAKKEEANPTTNSSNVVNNNGLHFVLGINSHGATVHVDDVDLTIGGAEFEMGLSRYYGKHRIKGSFLYTFYDLEEIEEDGVTYDKSKFDYELNYHGYGATFAYSYSISNYVGIGGYGRYSKGDLDYCPNDSTKCQTSDASVLDLGVMMNFKVSSWTPYLGIGRVDVKNSNKSYDGLSVYLGLLNFEI